MEVMGMPVSAARPLPSLGAALLIAGTLATLPALAQQRTSEPPRTLTAADYSRAERFMSYNTAPLVLRSGVRPTWLPDDRFWYRTTTTNGSEFIVVDPVRGTKAPAFDHAKLASALSSAAGTKYEPYRLPFQQFEFSTDGDAI